MLEKDMQTQFGKWLKANWKKTSAFELKICKLNKFNLKKIEKHQIANLKQVENGLLAYKISDSGIGQKPFDSFTLYREPAYLVLMFYKPRMEKRFYMISIDNIIACIKKGKKSITENEASLLADMTGFLK